MYRYQQIPQRKQVNSYSLPNFHYKSTLNKLNIQSPKNSLYNQQQSNPINNDNLKQQINNQYQHTNVNINVNTHTNTKTNVFTNININPQQTKAQTFRKCANTLLNYSPYNYQTTYHRNYTQQNLDYQPNHITNKFRSNNNKPKKLGIFDNSKYNRFQNATTYNSDYGIQGKDKNNKNMDMFKSNHYINNQQRIYQSSQIPSHRYGKQNPTRLKTQTNPIIAGIQDEKQKVRQTQYRKNFSCPKQTNMFKNQNMNRNTQTNMNFKQMEPAGRKTPRLQTQTNNKISKQYYFNTKYKCK